MVVPPVESALWFGGALRAIAIAAAVPPLDIRESSRFSHLFNRISRYFAGRVRRFCCAVEAVRHAC